MLINCVIKYYRKSFVTLLTKVRRKKPTSHFSWGDEMWYQDYRLFQARHDEYAFYALVGGNLHTIVYTYTYFKSVIQL